MWRLITPTGPRSGGAATVAGVWFSLLVGVAVFLGVAIPSGSFPLGLLCGVLVAAMGITRARWGRR